MTTDRPKILWHSHYFDGPIYGLAEHKGRKVWYEMCTLLEDKNRKFNLFELTDDNVLRIEEEQNRFRKEIGYLHEHDPKLFHPMKDLPSGKIMYQPEINCSSLKGKKIGTFSYTDFDQYTVPREITEQSIVQ